MAGGRTIAATSAEAVGSLDDFLIRILSPLPAKSLLRFKLVSKRWNSLISSRHFAVVHHRGPSPAVGLFYPGKKCSQFEYINLGTGNRTNVPFRELRFLGDSASYWIHQSCNGLLLCCSNGSSSQYGSERFDRSPIRSCYVYNPTTKCFTGLPRPGVVNEVPRIVVGLNLAFDHAKFPLYKVVCVRGSEFGPNLFQIEIYSAESGAWRLSGEPFRATASFNYGVYWNGSIHWVSYTHRELLYFNVEKEKFGTVLLPGGAVVGHGRIRNIGYFGESCNHLHIFEIARTQIAFNVYEMKRDYSEWFVKYRVDLTAVAAAFPDMVYTGASIAGNCYAFSVFSLVRGDGHSSFLVLKIGCKAIRFGLDCNTFEEICDCEDAVAESSSRSLPDFEYRSPHAFDEFLNAPGYMLPCACEFIESLACV